MRLINIFIIILMSVLTSCYASSNLGVIQKVNDASTVIDKIVKSVDKIVD